MPRWTRRQVVTVAGAWALGQITGIRPVPRRRAGAVVPDTLPIYLTFDDGVETDLALGREGPTIDVLDILDARGVPATFFVHGRNTGLAEGGVLARMLRSGHRVGNHLFHQGGATVDDQPTPAYMAQLFLDTEIRIRDALEPYPDELAIYADEAYPRLFRRPGGGYDNPGGNLFLMPDAGYWRDFQYSPEMAIYRSYLDWLEPVYDYSGWHISPLPLGVDAGEPEDVVRRTLYGYGGIETFRTPLPEEYPEATTRAALDGLIILLHDPDPRVTEMLPLLLDELDQRGAIYHALPRPVDHPNRYTVGISKPLEVVYPPGVQADLTALP